MYTNPALQTAGFIASSLTALAVLSWLWFNSNK
jgi:hypothetical protein